jgi:hypothetical protein
MLAVAISLLIGYWLPSFVAIARGHDSWWVIALFNLFLGWTVLGWIFALVWSLTTPSETAVTLRERFYGGRNEPELPGQWSARP